MKSTVYFGADHAGFDMKNMLREHLEHKGFVTEDLGAHELDPHDDYPAYAEAVAEAVLAHPGSFGILSCGNAEGICMAANKFDGIRAGIGYSMKAVQSMREDDDANILCIPGRLPVEDDPLKLAEHFVTTPFSGAERHRRRLAQMKTIEEEN